MKLIYLPEKIIQLSFAPFQPQPCRKTNLHNEEVAAMRKLASQVIQDWNALPQMKLRQQFVIVGKQDRWKRARDSREEAIEWSQDKTEPQHFFSWQMMDENPKTDI